MRAWFVLLVVSCIVPAAMATALLVYHLSQLERAYIERTTIDTARAMMQTVDRELFSAQSALQALATSPYLTSGALADFYGQAQEVLLHRPGDHSARPCRTTPTPLNCARFLQVHIR